MYLDLCFRQRSSGVSVCCGEPSLPVFGSCRCHSQFILCSLLRFLHWNPSVMMSKSLMYRLIYALLWPLGAKWLLRFHANAQIWSDFSELFDSTPELKMSVHGFQRSDGFLGHSGVLFSILSVTDCFCFRSPLTHSCTDTYNLHTVGHTATHSRPLSCAPAMTLCCFCFNGYLISVLSVSASVRPL